MFNGGLVQAGEGRQESQLSASDQAFCWDAMIVQVARNRVMVVCDGFISSDIMGLELISLDHSPALLVIYHS